MKNKILNLFGIRTLWKDTPSTQAEYVETRDGAITSHFDYDEFLQSNTAKKYGYIEQYTPSATVKANIIKLAKRLEPARVDAAIPFIFSSGYRCPRVNKNVGGVSNSAHVYGLAVDIEFSTIAQAKTIVLSLINNGFTRIGLGWSFIHVDIDETKPTPAVWVYGKTPSALKTLEKHYEGLIT